MRHYHLSHRCLIAIEGIGAISFLQDILTADIASLPQGQMRQSCLLSPQGRILIEMMILIAQKDESAETLYLACDASQRDELIKKLTLYRLRRKLTITPCETLALIASDEMMTSDEVLISAADERAQGRGYLSVISQEALSALTLSDISSYHAARLADAIPEGSAELLPNRALMLEAGLETFAAVDFKKGCYIGQEVTARTHYRGLVKRRLVPVIAKHLAIGDELHADDKIIGNLLATAPLGEEMIGLASMRLSTIHDAEAGMAVTCNGEDIRLAIPDHLRPLPKMPEK